MKYLLILFILFIGCCSEQAQSQSSSRDNQGRRIIIEREKYNNFKVSEVCYKGFVFITWSGFKALGFTQFIGEDGKPLKCREMVN